ncbi:Serine/threonine-protein phosphatase 7 long form homolog [Linum perenne]
MRGTGDIIGFNLLVELWALKRFPHIAERYIQWMSYADHTQDFALDGDVLWRAVTPLLCIDCIAWHHPDRCIRQFQFDQRVPHDSEPAGHVEELLAADFRSSVADWRSKYQQFVLHGEQRDRHIVTGEMVSDDSCNHFHDE